MVDESRYGVDKSGGIKTVRHGFGMAVADAMSRLRRAERLGETDNLTGPTPVASALALATIRAPSSLMEVGMTNRGGIKINTARNGSGHSEIWYLLKAVGVEGTCFWAESQCAKLYG